MREEPTGSASEAEGGGRVDNVLVAIVAALALLTVAFELGKQAIEARAGEAFAPVVDAVFGELTILGFIGLVSFLCVSSGLSDYISQQAFGDDEQFPELLETMHFLLFFMMCMLLMQVLFLTWVGRRSIEDWEAAENDLARHEHARLEKRRDYVVQYGIANSAPGVDNCCRHKRSCCGRDKQHIRSLQFVVRFDSLRTAFLRQETRRNSLLAQFENEFRLSKYFEFVQQERFEEMVEVPSVVWLGVLTMIAGILRALLGLGAAGYPHWLIPIYIVCGWLNSLAVSILGRKVSQILEAMLPSLDAVHRLATQWDKQIIETVKDVANVKELQEVTTTFASARTTGSLNSPLLLHQPRKTMLGEMLRLQTAKHEWSRIQEAWSDIPAYEVHSTQQQVSAAALQKSMFWHGEKGVDLLAKLFSAVLLVNSIYCAIFVYILILHAAPADDFDTGIWELFGQGDSFRWGNYIGVGGIYCAALIPPLSVLRVLDGALKKFVMVSSMGEFTSDELVNKVVRRAKAHRGNLIIRFIRALHKNNLDSAHNLSSHLQEMQKQQRKLERKLREKSKELTSMQRRIDNLKSAIKNDKTVLGTISDKVQLLERRDKEDSEAGITCIQSDDREHGQPSQQTAVDDVEEISDLFGLLDSDDNGKVTVQEISEFCLQNLPDLENSDVEELLKAADVDGSGDLTEREFIMFIKSNTQ